MAHRKLNKLLVILMHPKNPVWKRVFDSVKQASIHILAGVSASTLSNWRRGLPAAEGAAEKIADHLKHVLEPKTRTKKDAEEWAKAVSSMGLKHDAQDQVKVISEELHDFLSQKIGDSRKSESIVEIARHFGMEPDECRKIVDEAFYLVFPLFPGLYYETLQGDGLAEEYLRAFKGRYQVWMKRGSRWLGAALEVRYKLKVGDGWVIRCKMNIPTVNKAQYGYRDSWAYDGFLVVQPPSIFWVLEMRESAHADYLFMITKPGQEVEGRMAMVGTYLTTGQDTSRPVEAADVIFERISDAHARPTEDPAHRLALAIRIEEVDSPEGERLTALAAELKRAAGG